MTWLLFFMTNLIFNSYAGPTEPNRKLSTVEITQILSGLLELYDTVRQESIMIKSPEEKANYKLYNKQVKAAISEGGRCLDPVLASLPDNGGQGRFAALVDALFENPLYNSLNQQNSPHRKILLEPLLVRIKNAKVNTSLGEPVYPKEILLQKIEKAIQARNLSAFTYLMEEFQRVKPSQNETLQMGKILSNPALPPCFVDYYQEALGFALPQLHLSDFVFPESGGFKKKGIEILLSDVRVTGGHPASIASTANDLLDGITAARDRGEARHAFFFNGLALGGTERAHWTMVYLMKNEKGCRIIISDSTANTRLATQTLEPVVENWNPPCLISEVPIARQKDPRSCSVFCITDMIKFNEITDLPIPAKRVLHPPRCRTTTEKLQAFPELIAETQSVTEAMETMATIKDPNKRRELEQAIRARQITLPRESNRLDREKDEWVKLNPLFHKTIEDSSYSYDNSIEKMRPLFNCQNEVYYNDSEDKAINPSIQMGYVRFLNNIIQNRMSAAGIF